MLEELSRVRKESEKKCSDLKSALEMLKESDSALQHALADKKATLGKWKEAESSIRRARDE